ncbi:PH domain-containing protein [Dethiosulfovibrio sp. F2B]|uniref:PH domain-containing protein n=1 Tax=Dethiosulfovibrio faecalis TaxID=2720018 RepID=UPI001F479C3A|nr:PH domain-containing protein [Dethiosulfovibrio faecalis]MCF4150955.1 PH domain-containing protein [Dethiosulfovibrio faecalis]
MGLIRGLMGHATETDLERVREEFASMLIEGEDVQAAYKLVRDMFVFTDKRLIVMDKQGMTGKKVSYLTVPYGSIVCFSKESAGHFDLDAELKIWVRGQDIPLTYEFKKDSSIEDIYRILGAAVL